MNNTEKWMYSELGRGRLKSAQKEAVSLLKSKKTKTDEHLRKQLIEKLENQLMMLEIPANLANILINIDLKEKFDKERQVLSKKDYQLLKDIMNTFELKDKLSELNINYLNSILIHGDSGTGKTLFTKYIANELNLPYYYINFSHLIDSHLGSTGRNIHNLFTFINNTEGVIVLDELDTIGLKRGQVQELGEMNRIVINLMQELDNLDTKAIVIGVTNRYKDLDSALTRRFNKQYLMEELSLENKEKLVKKYLISCNLEYDEENIKNYIEEHKGLSNARLISDITQKIVSYLKEKNKSNVVIL